MNKIYFKYALTKVNFILCRSFDVKRSTSSAGDPKKFSGVFCSVLSTQKWMVMMSSCGFLRLQKPPEDAEEVDNHTYPSRRPFQLSPLRLTT